ncbi:MAG: hypothetical protein H7328_08225 [Bdellovibrio sp.]|nr:hypothetical protein [Bdellovibrio sp.]
MKKLTALLIMCASLNVFAANNNYTFQTITSCGLGEVEQFEVPHAYCTGDTQAYANWYNIYGMTQHSVIVEGSYQKPNSDIGFMFACDNGMITTVLAETKCILGGD